MRSARYECDANGTPRHGSRLQTPLARALAKRLLAIVSTVSLALVSLGACGPDERAVAMDQLKAPTPRERVQGVRALGKLGKPDDEELWVAIERLTRDPSVQVRIAAAESLATAPKADDREPDERGALADDALSAELSDIDETVRIAAARVLGNRCNPRAIAYLHGAFTRSGPAVRAPVAESLGRCGVPLEKVLARSEEVRRLHALEKLGHDIPPWRAAAARELGLLGRAEDVAKIAPLLDDRDGVVAAAAAEGLGFASAKGAAPALQKLAGDEVPLISMAAIDALVALGPDALAGAEAVLTRQAQADGEQAVTAAGALLEVGKRDAICAAALEAKIPAAAALLARGCPPAPFADRLASLFALPPEAKGGKTKDARGAKPPAFELTEAISQQAAALLEALSQAGPEEGAPAAAPAGNDAGTIIGMQNKLVGVQIKSVGTQTTSVDVQTIGEKPALALGLLCQLGDGELAIRAAQVAEQLGAKAAGPMILAVALREKAAIDAERGARKPAEVDRATAARELAEAAMRAPSADRQKIARLMAMVKARQEKNGGSARPDAAARLKQLLAGESPDENGALPRSALLAASLRAAVSLDAKGSKELADSLRDDPDRAIAAAARGDPIATNHAPAALAADCFPASTALSTLVFGDGGPDDGAPEFASPEDARRAVQSFVVRAPSPAAKPGCLAALLAQGPQAQAPGAIESARASLWSDDGAERAAACRLLARAADATSAPLRKDFTHDPERRVRDACTESGETASPGPR